MMIFNCDNQPIFSEVVSKYIIEQMNICIYDLSNKILNDVPKNKQFFNLLFEYMIKLKLPYTWDNTRGYSKNNIINRKYINKELFDFYYNYKLDDNSNEFFIFDNLRHAFINFSKGGIVELYQYREAEIWYPKVLISKFIGVQSDINNLENKITIYRGTSKEEYNSKKFGQSWSLSKKIANDFAYIHYSNQINYQNTIRVVITATVDKDIILYYSNRGKEEEVIIDNNLLEFNKVSIIKEEVLINDK